MPCAARLEMLAFGSCLCYTAKNTGTAPCSFAVAIYPREGTETLLLSTSVASPVLQFIPARGRKRLSSITPSSHLGCNLSPRGDGNQVRARNDAKRLGCNLSPRGDGNSTMRRILPTGGRLQFIPARGRKPFTPLSDNEIFVVAIYPREGTETRCIPPLAFEEGCNLSPRGDGNHGVQVKDCAGDGCNLSPRGDGNVLMGVIEFCFGVAIYPREGTETPH